MKKTMTIYFLFLPLLLSINCAVTPPTDEEIGKAYYGPCPQNYESIIKDYMFTRLIDGPSAIYKFKSPYKYYAILYDESLFGRIEYGWLVHVYINAKNTFGGYVGFRNALFVIRDGKVMGEDTTNLNIRNY